MTAQYAAVAENISKFRVRVIHKAEAKMVVNAAIATSLDGVFLMQYNAAMGIVNMPMARMAVIILENSAIRSGE